MAHTLAIKEFLSDPEAGSDKVSQTLANVGGTALEACGRTYERALRAVNTIRGIASSSRMVRVSEIIAPAIGSAQENDELFLGDEHEPEPEYPEAA